LVQACLVRSIALYMRLGSCFGLCQRNYFPNDHFKKKVAAEDIHLVFGSNASLPSVHWETEPSKGVPSQVSTAKSAAKAGFEPEASSKLQIDVTNKQCPGCGTDALPRRFGKKPSKPWATAWNQVCRCNLVRYCKCSSRLQKDDLDPDEANLSWQEHEPTIMKDKGDCAQHMAPIASGKVLSSDVAFDVLQSQPAEEVTEATKWQPPLEHRAVFENDLHRKEAVVNLLGSLRKRVNTDFFLARPGLVPGVELEARRFASDSTLLRHLIYCDGDEKKALASLKATLQWRAEFFAGKGFVTVAGEGGAGGENKKFCQCCITDPRAHCFLRVGMDAAGRHVVYSCAGAATNKKPLDGCRHMALELERIFDGNSAHGSIVWLINFAGFGIADCNPRTVVMALPMFLNNYPERISQIVLWGMPALCRGMYAAAMKLLDPIARTRIVIHKTDADRTRYAEAYWSNDAAMAAWLDAARHVQGRPGDFPELALSRQLSDAETRATLERCAGLRSK